VEGDWVNNATFIQGTSTVEMYASTVQQLITGVWKSAVERNGHRSIVVDQTIADGAVVLDTSVDLDDRKRSRIDLRTVVEEDLCPGSK
jgi:hypothetical protein